MRFFHLTWLHVGYQTNWAWGAITGELIVLSNPESIIQYLWPILSRPFVLIQACSATVAIFQTENKLQKTEGMLALHAVMW